MNDIFIASGRERKKKKQIIRIALPLIIIMLFVNYVTDSFSECILRVFFKLEQDLAFRNA